MSDGGSQIVERLLRSVQMRIQASQIVIGEGGFRMIRAKHAQIGTDDCKEKLLGLVVPLHLRQRGSQIIGRAQGAETLRSQNATLARECLPEESLRFIELPLL